MLDSCEGRSRRICMRSLAFKPRPCCRLCSLCFSCAALAGPSKSLLTKSGRAVLGKLDSAGWGGGKRRSGCRHRQYKARFGAPCNILCGRAAVGSLEVAGPGLARQARDLVMRGFSASLGACGVDVRPTPIAVGGSDMLVEPPFGLRAFFPPIEGPQQSSPHRHAQNPPHVFHAQTGREQQQVRRLQLRLTRRALRMWPQAGEEMVTYLRRAARECET